MADDDNEKVPEEIWAAEMAEDNYDEDEEMDEDGEPKQKKMKIEEKALKEKQKKDRIKKKREEEEEKKQNEEEENQEMEEQAKQQQNEYIDEKVQPIEVVEELEPVDPPNNVVVIDDIAAQAKGKAQEVAPQEGAEVQPIIDEEMDGLVDEFEQEMQLLAEHIGQPIDEFEPGFPQFNQFLNHPVQEAGAKEQIVRPQLPLFPLLEKAPKKEAQDMQMPLQMNPFFVREYYEGLPEARQRVFLEELRRNIPQLVQNKEPIEEPKNNEELLQVMQVKMNGMDDDDDDDDEVPLPILPPLPLPEPMEIDAPVEVEIEVDEELAQLIRLHKVPMVDEEVIRDEIYIKKRAKEEEEEYHEELRQEEYRKKKPKDKNKLSSVMKKGFQKHNENIAMKNIKKLFEGKPLTDKQKAQPFAGRGDIQNLNEDEQRMLFQRFTFQGRIMLFLSRTEWQPSLSSLFQIQKYLWFSNEEKHSKRFLPIEVCCDTCKEEIDTEPVIRIVKNFFLLHIIDEILVLTPRLKCLRLYRFEINRSIFFRHLKERCPLIKHLDLTECYGFRQEVIEALGEAYPGLVHLLLSSTNLDEQMFTYLLSKMKSLKTLDVSSTLIDGNALRYLPGKLLRLDIRCCPNITRTNMIQIAQDLKIKNLQHLKMDPIVNSDVYERIALKQQNLIVFEINEIRTVVLRAADFLEPIQKMTRLQSIKFGKNITVNDHLLNLLIEHCRYIRSFSLEFGDYGERGLTDRQLSAIPNSWPLLDRLEIINCPAAEKLLAIALKGASCLSFLNLTQCIRLRDDFFADVIKNMKSSPNYVVLDNCHNLGKGTLDALVIKANRLTHQRMSASMLRCNFPNLPYLKSKLLPNNLRLSYSGTNAKIYYTFDGKRMKRGRMVKLNQYLKD